MKLLLCLNCQDVFRLRSDLRNCECGNCAGRIIPTFTGKIEIYGEDCRLIELDPKTLGEVLILQEKKGDIHWNSGRLPPGRRFDAWLVPDAELVVLRKETV